MLQDFLVSNKQKQPNNNPYLEYIHAFKLQHLFNKNHSSTSYPQTLQCLSDGIIFYELLGMIKGFEIDSALIQIHPQTFIQKFTNLKTIMKAIQHYWENVLFKQLNHEQIDLVEITHNSNQCQIQKVCDLLIKTAILSQNNQIFIQKMLQTSSQAQSYFMKRVQQAMQEKNKISTNSMKSHNKQKQIKLYDKLMQLQHQNQKLFLVITDLCQQKQQSQQKIKALVQKLNEKDQDIYKLNEFLSQYTATPQKRRSLQYLPDTTQKHLAIIDQLNKRIDQIQIHEQQLIHNHEIQKQIHRQKLQKIIQLQNQKIFYQMTQKQNQEYCLRIEQLTQKEQKYKLQKNQNQLKLKEAIQNYNTTKNEFFQLEKNYGELLMELQIKNIKIDQLTTILQNKSVESSPTSKQKSNENFKNGLSSNSLFGQCEEFYNQKQNSILLESNKNLRIQIDRTSRKLHSYQAQIEKKTNQLQKMRIHEIQNKKLVDIISHMSSYRGQQNQILLKCLYELKMKQISSSFKAKKSLSNKNQNSLNPNSTKINNSKEFQKSKVSPQILLDTTSNKQIQKPPLTQTKLSNNSMKFTPKNILIN